MASEILYPLIGWLCLWLRYQNKKKVKLILENNYNNSYYNAGAELSMGIFGIIFIILLIVFLLVIIGRTIYDLL